MNDVILPPELHAVIDRVAEVKVYTLLLGRGTEDGGPDYVRNRGSLDDAVIRARSAIAVALGADLYSALRRFETHRGPDVRLPARLQPLYIDLLVGEKILARLGNGPAPCAMCEAPTVFRVDHAGRSIPECRRCLGLHRKRGT